jgi:membrane protease YdiL (CAAX protease family)
MRAQLARTWWMAPVAGTATAMAMAWSDILFFDGITIRDTPDLGPQQEPLGGRVLIAIFGSLGEEIVFRAGLATLVAWLVYKIVRHLLANPVRQAQWVGVFSAAATVGWMHVAQVDDPTRFWRIMTINFIGNVVYGALYWYRGFEMALMTHMTVTTVLYIGVPALR